MNFIFRMAWRDSRASRRRLVLASLSIVLGIAALVAIGSFNDNLRQAIDDQAKTLLGADLEVQSRVELTEEAQDFLDGLGGAQAWEVMISTMIVFPQADGATRLVSLRALEGDFPFYGTFRTWPTEAPQRLRQGGPVAILEQTLMAQFGVRVGDPVVLGTQTFTVIGTLEQIPGESAAVATFSPRVYIPRSELETTDLIGPGSLVRYKTYFRFHDTRDVEALVEELRGRFGELRLGFDTVERRKRDLGQSLRNVYAFLSLVGFVALFLGAIGVASAIHVHVRQKIATVAILRCVGASARQAFGVYLVQGLSLGLLGALLGAVLGVGVQLALPHLVGRVLPFDVDFFISVPAVVQGVSSGLIIGGLFTLLPLLAVRRVSPLVAIRAQVQSSARPDPLRWALYGAILVAVTGFALWQAPRWQVGLGFVGMLLVSFGALAALAKAVAWAARRFMPRRAPYVWRQGIANLHRPNNRTVLLLLALGLGTFLVVTLSLARATLTAQIEGTGGGERPNLLFFDIQDDQLEPLQEILAREGAPIRAQAPIVTMRLSMLEGEPVSDLLRQGDHPIPAWTLRREYRSTYRETLTGTEKLVAGEFIGRVEPDVEVVPVSLEVGIAGDLRLEVGDELEFDVQGLPVRARVASLREVEWRRLEPNFFVVFPAGVLEPAPKFFVAATRAETPEHSARLQREVVRVLPNVSAIDLAVILETLDRIFSRVEFVIQFMALFTVVTGVIVLAGAVLSGRFQRLREVVLLRTLGATQRQLVRIQLVEYALLGLLAALVGCGLAVVANALLARFVFETRAVVPVAVLVLATAGVTGITLLTGLLANRGVTRHPPLEVLRQET
jgi:putative ABC transport system permease protein